MTAKNGAAARHQAQLHLEAALKILDEIDEAIASLHVVTALDALKASSRGKSQKSVDQTGRHGANSAFAHLRNRKPV